MTMLPMKTHSIGRAAFRGLTIVLPIVMLTASAEAQVRESGTIRTGRVRPSQPRTQSQPAHHIQINGRTRIISQVPDDSAPYLKPVPARQAASAPRKGIIQLAGHKPGRRKTAGSNKSKRTANTPKVTGGLFGRIFGKKAKTATNRKSYTSKEGTVFTPFDDQPLPAPRTQNVKSAPVKRQRIVKLQVAAPVAAAVTQKPFVPAPVPPATPVVNRVRRTVTPKVKPIEMLDIVSENAQVERETVEPEAVQTETVVEAQAPATQSPFVTSHPLDFPDPFDEVSEAAADRFDRRQPVESAATPATDSDIAHEPKVDENSKDARSNTTYRLDPSLSPYTGVTLDDKPFEVTPQKPRPFPGVKSVPATSDTMSRGQMMKLVSGRTIPGLKGFCPVALLDKRKLVDTKTEFKARFGLKTYNFSSAEAKRRFELNPTRYLPVAGGNDVVRMSSTDEVVKGKLDHAAWFRGRLYLFESQDTRRVFFENPTRFVDLF